MFFVCVKYINLLFRENLQLIIFKLKIVFGVVINYLSCVFLCLFFTLFNGENFYF